MIFYKNTKTVKNTAEKLLNSPFMQKLPLPLGCKKLIAFTLAEVLITLLIIGVVASIVVPALVQDTQDAELKTAWKKTYSNFSQVSMKMVMDNGGNLKGIFTSDDEVYYQLRKYVNIAKYCRYGTILGNCWHNNQTKTLNGFYTWPNGTGFILNNGNLMFLNSRSLNCEGLPDNFCLHFSIDINGFKGPNTIGKDILGFYIFKNSIKPKGYQGDTYYQNTCDKDHQGWSCSVQYLYQ